MVKAFLTRVSKVGERMTGEGIFMVLQWKILQRLDPYLLPSKQTSKIFLSKIPR